MIDLGYFKIKRSFQHFFIFGPFFYVITLFYLSTWQQITPLIIWWRRWPPYPIRVLTHTPLSSFVLGPFMNQQLNFTYFMQCKCGQRRARLHPFSCPIARPHRAKLFSVDKKRPLTPSEILGSPEGLRLFASWAPETKLFGRNKSSGEASVT